MAVRKGDCNCARGRLWQRKRAGAAQNDDRAVRDAALKLGWRIERDPVPMPRPLTSNWKARSYRQRLVTAALMFAANYSYTIFRTISADTFYKHRCRFFKTMGGGQTKGMGVILLDTTAY